MVAAPCTVGIEVGLEHAIGLQVLACGGALRDRACRRDMVGGDRVAEQTQCPRIADRCGLGRRHVEVGKEGRVGDVGGLGPVVNLPRCSGHRVPQSVVLGEVAVESAEGARAHGVVHQLAHLFRRGPDIADVDVAPLLVLAQRLGHQIDVDVACDGIGHDQRRGRQEIGAQIRMDAGFEIAIAREHRCADHIVGHDGFVEVGRQVSSIADTRGAAIRCDRESELRQVRQQTGFLKVFGDNARSGGERCFDVRCHGESAGDGFLGQQAGGQQHPGVGRVGARCDRSDQHIAVVQGRATRGGVGLVQIAG